MAEKTNDVNKIEAPDPISAISGAMVGSPDPARRLDQRVAETVSGDPAETEHIKSQIEATRNQMGETIDAIQQKLSVENISNEVSARVGEAIETAKTTAYDATIGKAAKFMKNTGDIIANSKAAEVAGKNPIPLVLLGLGAGWLAYNSFSSRRTPSYRTRAAQPDEGRRSPGSARGVIGETYREGVNAASDAASSTYDAVSGAVSSAYSSAADAANRTYETAGEYAQSAKQTYEQYVESNPLAVGALAFAAGAALGFAFPSTRFESQIMGEARDKVLDKAQNAAGELIDKTKRLAEENRRPLKQSDSIVH